MAIDNIMTTMPRVIPNTATFITGPESRLPGNPPFIMRLATNSSYLKTGCLDMFLIDYLLFKYQRYYFLSIDVRPGYTSSAFSKIIRAFARSSLLSTYAILTSLRPIPFDA